MTTVRKLLAMGFLLLILAACGGDEEEPTPTPIPAAPAVATAVPAAPAAAEATAVPETTAAPEAAQAAPVDGDPLAAVTGAMQAQLAGGPYRALTKVESEGTITEMSAEVIPPDKMHIVIGGGNMEMILLDGSLWSRSGETPWQQMGSPDMMQGILDSIQGAMDASSLSNVQFIGEEPVYGEATRVFSFTSTLGEGESAIASDVKLWIGIATGLPVRMESNGSGMGMTTHTVQTIEYDNSIVIEAPTP